MTMKTKKTLQNIAAVAVVLLALCLVFMAPVGATDPVISGNVITVDTTNVQDVLDGKYGDLTGKTLLLTSGDYDTLILARATNYTGSNTVYNCSTHNNETTNAEDFVAHLDEEGWHTTPKYTTTFSGVTIKAADEATVTVAGVMTTSGHAYGDVYDYVRNIDYDTGSAYYNTIYMYNIVFEGITFDGKIDINTSDADTVYDGVTFRDCSFTTGSTASSNGAAIRYYNEANNGLVKNIVVEGCSFENCYQGIYTAHVNGIRVTDCTFNTTGHNAIAIQDGSVCNHGDVIITDNLFKNINDRAIRFNAVGEGTAITINNNIMVDSGDDEGELIKATSVAESGVSVNLEYNYWNKTAISTAVVNLPAPTVVGIISGTYSFNPSAYIAPGYEVVQPGNQYLVQKYVDRSSSSSSSSTIKPEEPEQPEEPVVEPENPTEEPVAGEPTVETEVTDGGEVTFETPETPEAGEPGDAPSEAPAEPAITGVVLPDGTDSEVAFIPVSEKPAPAGKEENTKKVFEINVPTYEKGKPATVKFTMTVAELEKDGKTAADVALWHQDEETGEWTKLVTPSSSLTVLSTSKQSPSTSLRSQSSMKT